MTHTFFPRCGNCEAPHPAVMGYDPANCHVCGQATHAGVTRTVSTLQSIRDPFLLIGQGFLILAQRLRNWIERQEK